jgi:hypothetical protein
MTRTAQRVFEHQRIWRVTPDALSDACLLLFAAISRDHPKVDHVIGVANGDVAPARILAGRLGVKPQTVQARHNADDGLCRQAIGKVTVDFDAFRRTLGRKKLDGKILVVDDIGYASSVTMSGSRRWRKSAADNGTASAVRASGTGSHQPGRQPDSRRQATNSHRTAVPTVPRRSAAGFGYSLAVMHGIAADHTISGKCKPALSLPLQIRTTSFCAETP